MEQIGVFFSTLPAAISALWTFGGGFAGLAISIVSLVLTVGFCAAAYVLRDRQGWLSATFGSMAILMGSWWLLGIIPSAWVYYADSQRELLEGTIIPGAITVGPLDVASNFYNLFRDTIVLVEATVVCIAGVFLAFAIQKRFPVGLADGEQRGPTTGGYK